MSVEATVVYLNFLIDRRRAIAEQAQAISSTAFRRGTPFTADEKAAMDACFQKLQSLDDLIPRQQAIVDEAGRKREIDERQREIVRLHARVAREKERLRNIAEDKEAKRIEKLRRQSRKLLALQEPVQIYEIPLHKSQLPKPLSGVWIDRTVAPRDDDVTVPVAEVDNLPDRDNAHFLASQVERQAASLISWGYKSLGVRHYSRRYEGYRRAAYG